MERFGPTSLLCDLRDVSEVSERWLEGQGKGCRCVAGYSGKLRGTVKSGPRHCSQDYTSQKPNLAVSRSQGSSPGAGRRVLAREARACCGAVLSPLRLVHEEIGSHHLLSKPQCS